MGEARATRQIVALPSCRKMQICGGIMIGTKISEQDLSKVGDIVARALAKRFSPEEFIFDPIVVKPDFDQDGDEILWIQIVFDGDQDNLDPSWTVRMFEFIDPELEELGITAYPITSFIEKSEWEDPAYDIPDWEE